MSTTNSRPSPSRSPNRCRRQHAARFPVLRKVAPIALVAILATGCPPPPPVTVPNHDKDSPLVDLEIFDSSLGSAYPISGDHNRRVPRRHHLRVPPGDLLVSGTAEDSGGVHRLTIMKADQLPGTGTKLASKVLDPSEALGRITLLPNDQLSAGSTRVYYAEAEDFHTNKFETRKYVVYAAGHCETLGVKWQGSPRYYGARTRSSRQVLQVMNLSSTEVDLLYAADGGGRPRSGEAKIKGETVSRKFEGLAGPGTWYVENRPATGKERILVCFK